MELSGHGIVTSTVGSGRQARQDGNEACGQRDGPFVLATPIEPGSPVSLWRFRFSRSRTPTDCRDRLGIPVDDLHVAMLFASCMGWSRSVVPHVPRTPVRVVQTILEIRGMRVIAATSRTLILLLRRSCGGINSACHSPCFVYTTEQHAVTCIVIGGTRRDNKTEGFEDRDTSRTATHSPKLRRHEANDLMAEVKSSGSDVSPCEGLSLTVTLGPSCNAPRKDRTQTVVVFAILLLKGSHTVTVLHVQVRT